MSDMDHNFLQNLSIESRKCAFCWFGLQLNIFSSLCISGHDIAIIPGKLPDNGPRIPIFVCCFHDLTKVTVTRCMQGQSQG